MDPFSLAARRAKRTGTDADPSTIQKDEISHLEKEIPMSEKKRTRSFLAIPMEEPALLSLVQLQQQLHQALPAARVMPQNQLHITLAFLGDSTESQLQKAEDIIRHLPVLDVVLHGQNLRLYGNALVLRLAPSAVLEEYVMKLQDALRQAGFSLEKEPGYRISPSCVK